MNRSTKVVSKSLKNILCAPTYQVARRVVLSLFLLHLHLDSFFLNASSWISLVACKLPFAAITKQ